MTTSIFVKYTRVKDLTERDFNAGLHQMPLFVAKKIRSFYRKEDAKRCLLGNLLVLDFIKTLGFAKTLADLQYTDYGRPFFTGFPDFNISHSGEWVVGALTEKGRVGIDIEEIVALPIDDFENEFSVSEIAVMKNSPDPFVAFYSQWTKKEAFLKAIGKGLSVPLNTVAICGQAITWNEQVWHLSALDISAGHISHLCTDLVASGIETEKVYF